MKTLFRAIALFGLGWNCTYAATEMDELEAEIREALRGSEWEIARDSKSITAIRRKVQFLNPIGLPSLPTAQVWDEYSFTSDYRITVCLDTKVTEAEYQELLQLKGKLTARRIAGITNGKEAFAARMNADRIIRLPIYYLDRFSVYIYASDYNFFQIRPESAANARDRVIAILDKSCTRYAGGGGTPAK